MGAAEPLAVVIGGRRAGTLTRTASSHRFEYDDDYAADPNATPLSVSMPLVVPRHSGAHVTAWLWGLLPDDSSVVTRWASSYGASRRHIDSLLATPIGRDCAGAVQFALASDEETLLNRSGSMEWLSDDDVSHLLQTLNVDAAAWHGEPSTTGQYSLAGAQPKLALAYVDGTWGRPSGAYATTHILKPGVSRGGDGTTLADQAIVEHLCMRAARIAGLRAASTSIVTFDAQSAIVVERFDRVSHGGGIESIERVHQEDMCQALGVHPDDKYESQGGPGARTIVDLLRSSVGSSRADEDIQHFVDALTYNWLIGGTDAHAKNYALLLSGPQVRLAPLYDVASALPYWHARRLRMAMKLSSENRVWPWSNPWPVVARQLRLDTNDLHSRVLHLAHHVPDVFERAASELAPEIRELTVVAKLMEEISAQCARCASVLGARSHPASS